MRKRRHFEKTTCCILLLLVLAGSPLPSGTPAFAISIEDETIVGSKFLESLRRQFSFVDDDFVNEYMNDLGLYLARSLDTEPFPFRFYVVSNNDLNAFAGPGGHIFFYTGLVKVMDHADEFASVICHEIGHVAARHLSNRIEQNKKIALATLAGMLASILIGGKAAGAVMTGTAAAGIQQQLNYSREDERQADQLGFKYMDLSGFDPRGMIAVLKTLEKGQWQSANAIPPYLLTHPGGSERISNAESMMTGHVPGGENADVMKFRKRFPFFKMTLIARYGDSQEVERLLKTLFEGSPDSALGNYGYGLLWKEKSEYTKAIEYLEKALKKEPTFLPILRNLGEAYQFKGQDRQAIAIFERALKISDQDKATLFLTAVSYQKLEEYDKAIVFYERLASMKPVKDEVYHNLGVSYGSQGKLAIAHFHFGIYFTRLGELQNARFHFHKAEQLAPNDAVLRNRIREAMETLRGRERTFGSH